MLVLLHEEVGSIAGEEVEHDERQLRHGLEELVKEAARGCRLARGGQADLLTAYVDTKVGVALTGVPVDGEDERGKQADEAEGEEHLLHQRDLFNAKKKFFKTFLNLNRINCKV